MPPKTQALKLYKMMNQKIKTYEVRLDDFRVKRKDLESIGVSDILPLGLDDLALRLCKDDYIYGHIHYDAHTRQWQIIKTDTLVNLEKKYQHYDRVIARVTKLSRMSLDKKVLLEEDEIPLDNILLFVENRCIAEAVLIRVAGKIALQIRKVNKDEK